MGASGSATTPPACLKRRAMPMQPERPPPTRQRQPLTQRSRRGVAARVHLGLEIAVSRADHTQSTRRPSFTPTGVTTRPAARATAWAAPRGAARRARRGRSSRRRGGLEQPLLVGVGPGERALLVAEQRALDERLRQRPQLTGTNGRPGVGSRDAAPAPPAPCRRGSARSPAPTRRSGRSTGGAQRCPASGR
jgi:hypothetical protein